MQGRRIKDYFGRDRKALYMILGILLVSISSLTIVYAALSVTLNIIGTADISAASWDVHLENVKVTSGSVSGDAPTITGGTTATFSTILTTPGDFYEFTIDVVNDGSIDAMIDSISKNPSLTTEQAKYLKYEITYQNGESINTKQLVKKNDFVRLKVRVEYRKDITASDLPTTSETLNLSFTVNYVQSDGSGSDVKDNGVKKAYEVISGDLQTVGSEVAIGDEHFYIISSDEDSVTMLSKMNITADNPPKQSSSAPLLAFSSDAYWNENAIGTYVYDSNSTLYNYVENYKTYLESQETTVEEARLIKIEELEALGCSRMGMSCESAQSWVYATSYWVGSAMGEQIYNVSRTNVFDYCAHTHEMFGVRPVIVISRGLIDGSGSIVTKQLIEFTIGDETYQAEEGMTWEQWVNSDYNIPSSDPNTTKFYVEVEYICRAVNLDTPDTEYDWIAYDQNGDSDVLATDVIENRAYYLI